MSGTDPATVPSPSGSESATKSTTKKPSGKTKAALDPAEIEAKRKARAEKKEREAREKAEKEAEALANGASVLRLDANGKPFFQPRSWASVPGSDTPSPSNSRIKVLSWNMLAQGLVRRKLFPGSDALRWKDREDGLASELTGHGWDVACFQEVDRLESHAETLAQAGYSYVFDKGYPQKQHGLMLAWRSSGPGPASANSQTSRLQFEEKPLAQKTFFYDDAEISPGRTASSRITRNIALFAAVKRKDAEQGVILATTHLFWHPMHAYERVRQAGLLVRALNEFRNQEGKPWSNWPTILAGDFNDQPHSASYRLMTGMGLDDHGREEFHQSRVVHQSVDERKKQREATSAQSQQPQQPAMATEQISNADDAEDEIDEEADDEEEGGADDQMLKNCRSAVDSDGLLTLSELDQLFNLSSSDSGTDTTTPAPLRSAYASAYHLLADPSESDNLFSTPARGRERWDDPTWKQGDPNVHRTLQGTSAGNEPMWTLYSSLFSLTLDFIFLVPTSAASGDGQYPKVTKLLRTHRTDTIKDGLPRKGICASDHVAIGAELEL